MLLKVFPISTGGGWAAAPVGVPGFLPVTVASVPTPYSELSTLDWALFTPADAADTVTTSPTPRARPSAMKTAWRIRRRSSRRRYVRKNIGYSSVVRPANGLFVGRRTASRYTDREVTARLAQ